ncbi:formate dehydrogenase accessory sulfurtransferase FdhD [Vibrio sp. CAIM 722]|uniref:Sulfur carrier protein FdhD n=1 Tax=Vibrio eleionomae TaxID=2653505 RepID=A0A7X4LJ10_9VIBR|nr:formate dehydrogenase accessory sulfurtransferase FdhD [Vibrio eleionomae]MZI92645.1 formate dehydrogenase accessory sulfurtransferase FdhD [Vibrio eleionomae]
MSVELSPVDFPAYKSKPMIRYQQGNDGQQEEDALIQETPVAIEFNGVAYTVMMCTPMDLEEFAVGFALTEGIIDQLKDVHDVDIEQQDNGITVNVRIANRCVDRLQQKRRSLAGMTGCGICGTEKLDSVCRYSQPLPTSTSFDIENLQYALDNLHAHQVLNQVTGSSHAAAYLSAEGEIEAIFEDVGRHIALDKLVGWVLRQQKSQGAILVTSRASFEMVQKVVASGVQFLFAVSAATNMAVEMADQLNLTLCGYCRRGRANIYTHPERLNFPSEK